MNQTLVAKIQRMLKQAAIKENMVKRIFFSLLGTLVPAGEEARIALTRGAVDYNALKQLIPGAKELVSIGVRVCAEEARLAKATAEGNRWRMEVNNQSTENPEEALRFFVKMFGNPKIWDAYIGGESWKKIAETLLNIHLSLKTANEKKATGDWDAYYDNLMSMTVYMNVLDGLAHNSGSLIDKMLTGSVRSCG